MPPDGGMDIRREILRNVILCQALAQLGKKHGSDWPEGRSLGAKVEHYIVAGVNSSWHFYDLADRVIQTGGQPDCIYDLAYEAQKESARNHLGGHVNYGQVQLLVPLVTAQVLDYLESGTHEDVDSILQRTGTVLRNTTARDVESIERYMHLGYRFADELRARSGRPTHQSVPVLKGRYATVWEAAQDYQNVPTVRETTAGYPYSQQVYRFLLHNIETGILPAIEMIRRFLMPEIRRTDVVGDLVATGLYLLLTKHPEGVLFI
ncbi:MAG TPA: hypothetical protein VHQ90_21475 [Thermoanaerobaculia bacterium]|nr:hypothetical protein [Thermoanaerobaculia bacterium]